MRPYLLAVLLAVAACDRSGPPSNAIEEVSDNNMIADEVTEVPDDSATAPLDDEGVLATPSNGDQTSPDEASSEEGRNRL